MARAVAARTGTRPRTVASAETVSIKRGDKSDKSLSDKFQLVTPFQIWRAWPSEEGLHQAALRRHLTNDLQRVGSGGETGEIGLPDYKLPKKQVLHSVPVTPVKPAVKTEPQVIFCCKIYIVQSTAV